MLHCLTKKLEKRMESIIKIFIVLLTNINYKNSGYNSIRVVTFCIKILIISTTEMKEKLIKLYEYVMF